MEKTGADGSLNLSSGRAISRAQKFQRFRTGCGCVSAAMAVVFALAFFGVSFSGLRDIRQTVQVDGRIENVWQSEVKDPSGALRARQEAVVGYRFRGVDYKAQVSPKDRVLRIGDQVPVFINPRSPTRAGLRKPAVADLMRGGLIVAAVFLLLPFAVSYGIYRWLGKIQVDAYHDRTPPPDRTSIGMPPDGEASGYGTAGSPRPAATGPSAGLRETIKSWLITVSPVLLVIAWVGVSTSMGWRMSSSHFLLALVAAVVLQRLIGRRMKKAANRIGGMKTRTEVRLPNAPPSESPLRFEWPWSDNPYPWLIGAGVAFLSLAAVFGFISVQGKLRGDRILAGEKVRGKVIGVIRASDGSSSSIDQCLPVVNYSFAGKEFQYRSRRRFFESTIQVGDSVTLLVNPENPQEAAIDISDKSDAYHHVTWFLPLMFVFFGWEVLGKGLAMRRDRPPGRVHPGRP